MHSVYPCEMIKLQTGWCSSKTSHPPSSSVSDGSPGMDRSHFQHIASSFLSPSDFVGKMQVHLLSSNYPAVA